MLGLFLAPDNMSVESYTALARARSGDAITAKNEMRKSASQFPLDTLFNYAKLPSVQAAIDMSANNPESALHVL